MKIAVKRFFRPTKLHDSLFHDTSFSCICTSLEDDDIMKEPHSQIKLSLLHFHGALATSLVLYDFISILEIQHHIMQRQLPWHYLCSWQIGLPLCLNSAACINIKQLGRPAACLCVLQGYKETQQPWSDLESTCHCQWYNTQSLGSPPQGLPLFQVLTAICIQYHRYSHNLMPGLDVGSQCLKCNFDINQ